MSKITDFCIAECKRQNDLTPEAVAGMVEAYYLATKYTHVSLYEILELGEIVKPQNKIGFRNTPVVFQNGSQGVHYTQIDRTLVNLIRAKLTPEEFYKEFELIHPFEDGNGRVGAILYNFYNGTMDNPVCPPDMFG